MEAPGMSLVFKKLKFLNMARYSRLLQVDKKQDYNAFTVDEGLMFSFLDYNREQTCYSGALYTR
jgi:hypothetical protein